MEQFPDLVCLGAMQQGSAAQHQRVAAVQIRQKLAHNLLTSAQHTNTLSAYALVSAIMLLCDSQRNPFQSTLHNCGDQSQSGLNFQQA